MIDCNTEFEEKAVQYVLRRIILHLKEKANDLAKEVVEQMTPESHNKLKNHIVKEDAIVEVFSETFGIGSITFEDILKKIKNEEKLSEIGN